MPPLLNSSSANIRFFPDTLFFAGQHLRFQIRVNNGFAPEA